MVTAELAACLPVLVLMLAVAVSAVSVAGVRVRAQDAAREAAREADVLVTDIWVSLGQEATRPQRLKDLEPYRLDGSLLSLAAPGARDQERELVEGAPERACKQFPSYPVRRRSGWLSTCRGKTLE